MGGGQQTSDEENVNNERNGSVSENDSGMEMKSKKRKTLKDVADFEGDSDVVSKNLFRNNEKDFEALEDEIEIEKEDLEVAKSVALGKTKISDEEIVDYEENVDDESDEPVKQNIFVKKKINKKRKK